MGEEPVEDQSPFPELGCVRMVPALGQPQSLLLLLLLLLVVLFLLIPIDSYLNMFNLMLNTSRKQLPGCGEPREGCFLDVFNIKLNMLK